MMHGIFSFAKRVVYLLVDEIEKGFVGGEFPVDGGQNPRATFLAFGLF